MRAKLVNVKDCALPFLKGTAQLYNYTTYTGTTIQLILVQLYNLYWYNYTTYTGTTIQLILVQLYNLYWYNYTTYTGTTIQIIFKFKFLTLNYTLGTVHK